MEGLLHDIKPYFIIHKDYNLGEDIDSVIARDVSKRKSFHDYLA